MEEKHKNTSQLLEKLILSITQLNQSDPTTNKLLSYSLRILQSNIGGNRLDLDDQAIKNQLQKAAEKANPRQLDRIYDLVSQFERSRVVQQKNGILKLLIKLSNTKNISNDISLDTSIFQTKDPVIQKPVSQSQQIISHQQHQNKNQNYRSSSTANLSVQQHQQMSCMDNNTTAQSYNHTLTKNNNSTLTDICKKISDKGNEAIDLKENDLVSDIIFIFQGIDGHYIQFFPQEKAYQLKANVPVKESVREQINQLCEIGWLFKKVTDFLKLNPQGLINQSLHLAIKEELNEYYRLIAVLENLKNESIENSADPLTLRKLALWMRDPFERMKWLAIISDACKNLIGCQVISQIFSYSGQGNMQINGLITRLLSALNQPLLKYLYNWVYLGELNDKLGEFFIIEHLNVDNNNLWNKKYSINYEQIPSVIEKKVVEKIFDIGKCVNFLHKCCNFTQWQLQLIKPFEQFDYNKNYIELKQWVDQASILTSQKLVQVLQNQFHLKLHFESIKKLLLMGQGEFIQILIESMQEELNKQANLILKNNLVALLESAIRSSNVQYMNQDIQQRLDVKLLQASSGDRGWDIFSLNYIVENPIQTILTPETMLKYLKIFNFLWRIKRVAHSLSEVWLLHMKNNRYLSHFKYLKQTSLRCNMLRQEMLHFIDNLFNYLMVEVIETAWKHFQDSLNNIKDFKEIIDVHQKFVDQILERLLLTQKSEKIHRQLLRIFDLILRFKYTQDMMITDIQEEYNRKKQIKLQRDALNIIGENLNSESEESGDEALKQNEKGTLQHFKQISSDFKTAFTELQSLLKKEDDLRFLTFRIDFNEFYSSKKQYGSLYDMEELKSHGFDQKMFQNNSQFFSNNNQQQHQLYQQQLQQQQNKLRVFPSQHKFTDTTNQPQANYFKNVINSDYNQKKQQNQQSNLGMQFKKDNYLQPQQLQTSNMPQQNLQQQAFNNFVNLTGKTSNYSDITQQQPPQNKFFNKQFSYNEGSSMINNNNKNTINYFNKMEEEKNKNQIENNTNNYSQHLNLKNNNNQQNFYQQESEDDDQDQKQQLDQQQQFYNDDDVNNKYSDQDD